MLIALNYTKDNKDSRMELDDQLHLLQSNGFLLAMVGDLSLPRRRLSHSFNNGPTL